MQPWLLIAAAVQAASSHGAADFSGLAPVEIGHLATAHALDLRVVQTDGNARSSPLVRGMLFQHDVAPNAALGVGLANLYTRRKPGFDGRDNGLPKRSRKPAVTFLLKF